MRNNSTHAMFPDATHDEQALQNYIKTLRVFSTRNFHRGNKALLAAKIEPALRRKAGNKMPARKDVREALAREEHNQWWSAMVRTTQEMLYDSVGPSIERQLPDLTARAKKLRGRRTWPRSTCTASPAVTSRSWARTTCSRARSSTAPSGCTPWAGWAPTSTTRAAR
jgi:hypothetical protein